MSVTGDGGAVIAHAGSIGLRMLAENTGLTGALSTAMARRSFIPSVHDRGQVLTDVAVMLADGGEAISDIDVLRHQGQVLGPVASAPTVWRALDEVTDARRRKIQAARARVRRHVWAPADSRWRCPGLEGRRDRSRQHGGVGCRCHDRGDAFGEGVGVADV